LNSKPSVVGAGIISSIGTSWVESYHALRSAQSGIGPLSVLNSVNTNKFQVGEVKLSNEELAYRVGSKTSIPRTALLGIHAAKEAYLHSGIRNINYWRVGIVSSTTGGGMDKSEQFYPAFMEDISKGRLRDIVNHTHGSSTEIIAEALGIKDFISTINISGSSSSIIYAARLIKHNKLDVVFAGGTDALTNFALNGYAALKVLDQNPCRPFDMQRNGLNLGEGAAYVVLVSDRVLEEEGIVPLANLAGYASIRSDADCTSLSLETNYCFTAMRDALKIANLNKHDVNYINLHGEGSIINDFYEGDAVNNLFSESNIRLSSTKSFTGHTQGACCSVEAIISLMSLKHECIFPNLRCVQPIPEIGTTLQQKFVEEKVNNVMVNGINLDGNYSSIIFSK